MKVGAEPRKVAILAGLLLVAAYLVYSNIINPDDGIPEEARVASTTKAVAPPSPMAEITQPRNPPSTAPGRSTAAQRRLAARASQEFEPRIGSRRPEDRPDPTALDPTLRVDLLAKLKQVTLSGGDRSLFDFSQPPAPKVETPAPKILPTKPVVAEAEKPAEPAKPPEPVKPPPPPIPLKFYGFVAGSESRRAFFIQGEEIYVAAEGELVQKRYKIVRIGVNSAVVEDTEHKHQQTLPLEPAPA
jgi:hypothetical protein